MAVQKVEAILRRFEGMKTKIPLNVKTKRKVQVDLDVRLYDHMPFGPIYQIGDEIMYVGFFVNFETSSDAPMLEIRNTPGNRWWRQFEREFSEAWAVARRYEAVTTKVLPGSRTLVQPIVEDAIDEPLE